MVIVIPVGLVTATLRNLVMVPALYLEWRRKATACRRAPTIALPARIAAGLALGSMALPASACGSSRRGARPISWRTFHWSIGPGCHAADVVLETAEPRDPDHYRSSLPAGLNLARALRSTGTDRSSVALQRPQERQERVTYDTFEPGSPVNWVPVVDETTAAGDVPGIGQVVVTAYTAVRTCSSGTARTSPART